MIECDHDLRTMTRPAQMPGARRVFAEWSCSPCGARGWTPESLADHLTSVLDAGESASVTRDGNPPIPPLPGGAQ